MWCSENSLGDSDFSVHPAGPRDWTQVPRDLVALFTESSHKLLSPYEDTWGPKPFFIAVCYFSREFVIFFCHLYHILVILSLQCGFMSFFSLAFPELLILNQLPNIMYVHFSKLKSYFKQVCMWYFMATQNWICVWQHFLIMQSLFYFPNINSAFPLISLSFH